MFTSNKFVTDNEKTSEEVEDKKPSSFPLPKFPGNKLPTYSGAAPSFVRPGSTSSFAGYNPNVHKNTGVLKTTPISEAATAKVSGLKLNSSTLVPKKEPYLVIAVEHEGDTVCLYDIDSKRFLVSYQGDLPLITSDGLALKKSTDRFDTPHGNRNGYIFYKGTQKYIDLLNDIFPSEWQDGLHEPLPKIEVKTPGVLWEGDIDCRSVVLVEYSDVSCALLTEAEFSNDGFMLSKWPLVDPKGGSKKRGYVVSKNKGKGISELRKIIPIDFGALFVKSPAISAAPIVRVTEPILMEKRNVVDDDGNAFEVKLYSYSDVAYAVFFNPPVEIGSENMSFQASLRIDGVVTPGYTLAKSNTKAVNELKTIMPGVNLDELKPSIMKSDLGNVIPASKVEQSIADLAISLFAKMSKSTKFERYNAHGKVILFGLEDEVADAIGNELDPEVLMKIEFGEKLLIIVKTCEA